MSPYVHMISHQLAVLEASTSPTPIVTEERIIYIVVAVEDNGVDNKEYIYSCLEEQYRPRNIIASYN